MLDPYQKPVCRHQGSENLYSDTCLLLSES
jgi:hypothetical protein